jgi:Cu2+-containing amine oxidase
MKPEEIEESFGLIRENNRLQENDIKFRMIRQSIPEAARWADTTYHNNPVEVEKMVKRLDLGHEMILSSSQGLF